MWLGGRRLEEPRPGNGRRERGWAGLAHVSCLDKQSLRVLQLRGASRTFTGPARNEFCSHVGQESVGSDAAEVFTVEFRTSGRTVNMVFQRVPLGEGSWGQRGCWGLVFMDTDTLGQSAGRALLLLQRQVGPKEQNRLLRESDFAIFPRLLKLIKQY